MGIKTNTHRHLITKANNKTNKKKKKSNLDQKSVTRNLQNRRPGTTGFRNGRGTERVDGHLDGTVSTSDRRERTGEPGNRKGGGHGVRAETRE